MCFLFRQGILTAIVARMPRMLETVEIVYLFRMPIWFKTCGSLGILQSLKQTKRLKWFWKMSSFLFAGFLVGAICSFFTT